MQLLLTNDPKLDTDTNRRRQSEIEAAWKRCAPDLVCRCVSGNHLTCLKLPHVRALSRRIQGEWNWQIVRMPCRQESGAAGSIGRALGAEKCETEVVLVSGTGSILLDRLGQTALAGLLLDGKSDSA